MDFHPSVWFYAAAWSLAAASGLLVTFRDRRYRDPWELLATAALCGLIAVSVLGVVLRVGNVPSGDYAYMLGVAIVVGLLGEKGLLLVQFMVAATFKRFGVPVDESLLRRPGSSKRDNSNSRRDSDSGLG